ncbi:quinone oxidoreductase [Bosea sp. (in: a-proteobacteria)]|uniref:quinone oxidoreductase family protein n=1 Tax=Bosea sp. (in: a-proteobacteria) TaxID=1871050 RepID=UPI001AC70C37|nr:quinone oxidoreductase [Bosea sp. (in: a-proteobacteria)]MBN9439907.1 quinone oxidoreductase [Bosea sp. (in: a-proteobacteria)]MBN9448269.1 quinone oxidoreductase [Bosea sp. (in: a-proteobacteria)]
MVKAIRVHKTGGPDVLQLEDIALPAPGPGQLLIRNRAIGLNFIDTYFRTGLYPAPQLPFTPGNESAGDVLAVGEGVTEFKPGDRIACVAGLGAYAEERIVPAAAAVALPDAVSYEAAASMMLKGLTAEYLLHRTYKVKPGDTILVHAAAGGTGTILCQWGKALGATVIGTAGSKEKADLARAHGADHVILYGEEDVAARVKEITGGQGCDVVYDGVGKDTFVASLDSLKPFGLLASFGNASGAVDGVNLGILASKGSLYVTRPTLNTHTAKRETMVEMAKNLFGAVSSGKVTVAINARFPLAEAAAAHRALESRGTTGSTVIIP